MVKVSIEVRSGSARFTVGVRAESVERAMNLVGSRYSGEVRVKAPAGGLPLGRTAPAALTVSRQPHGIAA